MNIEENIAYFDAQNIYMATAKKLVNPWRIHLKKFRVYLEKKYKVKNAYYFPGHIILQHQDLYEEIQKAGFILVFKEHTHAMVGKKKGNVDTDIVFHIIKKEKGALGS